MTGDDFREAMRWSLIAIVVAALWFGVLSVREARAAMAAGPDVGAIQMMRAPIRISSEGLRPFWIITVYEVRGEKLIGITEFVFESYEECQLSSAEAKEKLGLKMKPVCHLRWMKMEGVSKGDMM